MTESDDEADVCIGDARLLGPAFEQRVYAWKQQSQDHVDEFIRDVSSIEDRRYVEVFAQLHFQQYFPASSDVQEARTRIKLLRCVANNWGLDVVLAYNWKTETTSFCRFICSFSRLAVWSLFVAKLNRIAYIGKRGKITSHTLVLLRRQWDTLQPLRCKEHLDDTDKHYYSFDSHGLLHLTQAGEERTRLKIAQAKAFEECRRPKSISFAKDLPILVVNYYARHLTRQIPSKCFVLPADYHQPTDTRFDDVPESFHERAVRLVRAKTWVLAIKKAKGVELFDPTGLSTRFMSRESRTALKPRTVSGTKDSGVLLLGYLERLLRDPEAFLSNLHQGVDIHIDILALQKDIEEVVLGPSGASPGQTNLMPSLNDPDAEVDDKVNVGDNQTATGDHREAAKILAGLALASPRRPSSKRIRRDFTTPDVALFEASTSPMPMKDAVEEASAAIVWFIGRWRNRLSVEDWSTLVQIFPGLESISDHCVQRDDSDAVRSSTSCAATESDLSTTLCDGTANPTLPYHMLVNATPNGQDAGTTTDAPAVNMDSLENGTSIDMSILTENKVRPRTPKQDSHCAADEEVADILASLLSPDQVNSNEPNPTLLAG